MSFETAAIHLSPAVRLWKHCEIDHYSSCLCYSELHRSGYLGESDPLCPRMHVTSLGSLPQYPAKAENQHKAFVCFRMQLAGDFQGKPSTVKVGTPQSFLVALPGLRALSQRLNDLSAGASKLNRKLRFCNGSSVF